MSAAASQHGSSAWLSTNTYVFDISTFMAKTNCLVVLCAALINARSLVRQYEDGKAACGMTLEHWRRTNVLHRQSAEACLRLARS